MAKYAIIIVTYNSAKDIAECIQSVKRHTTDYELIVVDNASSDLTRLAVAVEDVKVHANQYNIGYSAAINQGIQMTTAEYVIMLNPDTVVYPLWAERMANHFNKPNVGAVGPMSTNCIGYQSVANYELKNDCIPEAVLMNAGAHVEVKLVVGFCLMTRRGIINRIGGLDPNLFFGNDDLDFCWRLRESGYKIVLAMDAFIDHKLGQSSKSNSNVPTLVQESTDYLYRKLMSYYHGVPPTSEELWGIPWFKPSQKAIQCQ